MGRIRTTRQARVLRADVLYELDRERERQRWRDTMMSFRTLQAQRQAELRHDLRVLGRRETMEKFRHRRPTSL